MVKDLDALGDDMLAAVFAHLDLRSLLRTATLCKRFWNIVFASHNHSAVWTNVRIGPDVVPGDLEKFTLVLQDFAEAGIIKSLNLAEFSPFKLEVLPSMPGLRCLTLERGFLLDVRVLSSLAAKFPNLVAFETPEAEWNYNFLGIVRNVFPSLDQVEFSGCLVTLGDADFNDLLDTFEGLKRLDIRVVRLEKPTSSTLDRLAGSGVAKSICFLELANCHASSSPEKPFASFKSVKHLDIHSCSRQTGAWIAPGMLELPNLVSLDFAHYQHLDLVWAMPDCGLPPNLSIWWLHECKHLNSAFVYSVRLRLSTLNVLDISGNVCFHLSEAILVWLGPDSQLEYLEIKGRLFTAYGNSKDELNLVFSQLVSRSISFENLQFLELSVTLVSGDVDVAGAGVTITLDEQYDLAEMSRLMHPEPKLRFGDRVIPHE